MTTTTTDDAIDALGPFAELPDWLAGLMRPGRLEASLRADRVYVERIRRDGRIIDDIRPDTLVARNDVLAIGARHGAFALAHSRIGEEVNDEALLDFPIRKEALVVTSRLIAGHSIEELSQHYGRGLYLARIMRGQMLSLKQNEYIESARANGAAAGRIISKHVIPNAIGVMVVSIFLEIPNAILGEAFLSFLGLGDPSQMSWGFMIGAARNVVRDAWWLSIWPGLAIVATALAVNRVGEGLRHASALAEHGR